MPQEPFSLFGFGPGGLPDEFDIWLGQDGEVELLAEQVIKRWKELAVEKQGRGRRGVVESRLEPTSRMLVAAGSE